MADQVEDIKGRLSIVDVVGQYVRLKKAGVNFKGLCPFHNEKSPSFVVSPAKQICHCFGCNKGGDIFTFVQELEGISFAEALEMLAERAGVKLEKKSLKVSKEKKSEKEEFYRAQELASQFFEKQLWESEDGKKVRGYLEKRGVNEKTMKKFRLGFAPDAGKALYDFLIKEGVNKRVMLATGLVSSKSIEGGDVYDKFRQRLMFPIFNYMGKVCAFGGRALSRDQQPKYLNSPESSIYNKSKVLYGLSHAKKNIKEEGKVVFVEGYFDVILPVQEGMANVVATCGTALTDDQVYLVKRLCDFAVTCFDNDQAGFEATKRAFFALLKNDFVVKTAELSGGKDAADMVLSDKDGFRKVLVEARDFLLVYLERLKGLVNFDSLEGKKQVIGELAPIIANLKPLEKDFFVGKVAKSLEVGRSLLLEELQGRKVDKYHPLNEVRKDKVGEELGLEELMFGILLEYPYLFEGFEFDGGVLSESGQEFVGVLKEAFDGEDFAFSGEVLGVYSADIAKMRLRVEEKYGKFSKNTVRDELGRLSERLVKMEQDRVLGSLKEKIKSAEDSGDMDALKRLLKEQQELLSGV